MIKKPQAFGEGRTCNSNNSTDCFLPMLWIIIWKTLLLPLLWLVHKLLHLELHLFHSLMGTSQTFPFSPLTGKLKRH